MDYRVYKSLLQESSLDAHVVLDKLGYDNLSPVDLRRIFLLLTRACYSDTRNYGDLTAYELRNPELKYSKDKYAKTIDVELDYIYDADEVNVRPVVFVGLGDITFQRTAIGDYAGISEDRSTVYHTNQSQGTVVFRHIATSPDLAYAMSDITVKYFLAGTSLLREGLPGLLDFNLQGISKINFTDADRERNYRVDVVFNFAFSFVWSTRTEDQPLTTINLTKFDV